MLTHLILIKAIIHIACVSHWHILCLLICYLWIIIKAQAFLDAYSSHSAKKQSFILLISKDFHSHWCISYVMKCYYDSHWRTSIFLVSSHSCCFRLTYLFCGLLYAFMSSLKSTSVFSMITHLIIIKFIIHSTYKFSDYFKIIR